ncbi:M42 family metallopeptidase [Paenactinomyces guangxiensis]|uniref:M42 family metallopeptidase n=1 Tax=Paenactinomyces guangxiensis TaxID=1490290 RepID=A0A7W1WN02_9BACL|nr:M42 family metallopeptidase [Paenactinomyces guangxiensis]MBA4492876.1 M42 family metallopeptidase [Paenactinomyces guangxiensis]MBH8590276.1 M42 family metallopeptidase [Paenactinomyces guangxiensis]
MSVFPEQRTVQTLVDLLKIDSPAGHTERAIDYIEKRMQQIGIETARNNKGGLLVTLPGQNDTVHRFLTAHVDTLGAMVKEIKPNGRLILNQIGYYEWFSVEGAYCCIETREGKRISGTILSTHTSVHVYPDAKDQKRTAENIEVRLDARVNTAEDVRELGIRVGDFVSFDPQIHVTETGFIKSRHLDDKASVAVLIELIAFFKETDGILPHTTHFLFSNNEEVGFGGNSNIPAQVREYLAVDMGAIGEGQATDEFCVSICAKDGSGPYHYGLRNKLVQLAEENGITHQVDIYPYYTSDASAAVRAGSDVIHGLIGPGVDASHAYERTHIDALENTFRLLYHYLLSQSL